MDRLPEASVLRRIGPEAILPTGEVVSGCPLEEGRRCEEGYFESPAVDSVEAHAGGDTRVRDMNRVEESGEFTSGETA
jgi:hypothetical protein